MKKKVLIDSISLLSPLTGVGRYTNEIAKHIKDSNKYEMSFFYGYYSKILIKPATKSNVKIIKSVITKNQFLKKITRQLIFFYSKFFQKSYDLYWQPNFIPNLNIKAKKTVTTVHDFSFILHKDFHPKERIEYFENSFFKNIIKSDIIITGSKFSKREILERLDFKDEQVKVIYHGLNNNIFKVYKDTSLAFDLPKKFILSVGSIEPRKNLLGLLKAYNLLDKTLKDEYSLVLVGFKGWENKELMQLIEKNKENIHYLGFISDKELAKVYNKATCFAFTSFYEGFGLPILEAMACSTPVISSNTSSMPEVGGDCVVYCNPNDTIDIKNKIQKVLQDEKLQKNLKDLGLQRAKNFSWEKSAKEHIKVFEELLYEA